MLIIQLCIYIIGICIDEKNVSVCFCMVCMGKLIINNFHLNESLNQFS